MHLMERLYAAEASSSRRWRDGAPTARARLNPGSEDAVYRTLLESTRAIPWKIDWSTMRFAYIGPQIESLTIGRRDCELTLLGV
jgi:hypothetical protein